MTACGHMSRPAHYQHGPDAVRFPVTSDLKNELNAALVSFVTSRAMLRDLRAGGRVLPEEAARILAGAIEVVEQIH
jgi:hypothetical protein